MRFDYVLDKTPALPEDFFNTCRMLSWTVVQFGTDASLILLQDGTGSSVSLAQRYGQPSSLGRQGSMIRNFPKEGGGLLGMTQRYVGLVKGHLAGHSECLVGGWSVGRATAFEVARQLIASDISVPGLVIGDSLDPETSTAPSKKVLNGAFPTKSLPGRAMELARLSIRHATVALVDYDPSHCL
ncbi:uncharacterized protein PHACADRAFT_211448 [Phanerochaete carnosa HHB-10118-sp]|uniref:Thioesterase domain-containing protein n=1 Tax=Phanerochaete carnosa (strain HHB-10118-sp) TaxID=650164 RepID=K5W3X8_PHACS|nr:uncharacterized protein PHACADRAFT_211448 [Phanerochaete carnosa HHB-10118-sp]EKM53805.1 hypothetical protein PHACADRAFT_211448 [Phanerochaete carnosa HHB-10118-sp]